ncbi:UNVERIFIED_CONTAM: hypothetical protein PYX00_003229 [Menopon gallinae]|uniref:Uncharacterized protein n=1 Tax=Menopon gallinae TaxID=328185 RepID=A0AAW2I1J0_9NEOP
MKIKVMRDNVIDLLVFLALALVYIVESIVQLFVPINYRTKRISGDIVLITGGGGGLGRLLAERFAKMGCVIVVWDINKKAVEETVEKVKSQGGVAHGYVCDITNRERVYSTAKDVKREVGRVSILINNAGMVSGKPFLETPDALIEKTFDVNVISHFWTVKAFLPDMIDSRRGHIVTIASLAGTVGMTKLVDYCASKYAAIGFDESLRIELECYGHHNIHTTVICPYFIKSTGMFDGVHTRFIPILEAPYVADRIVQAVVTNEKQVYLPGIFRALLLLKGFVPWRVSSMFLRALVQDAHPDHIVNKNYTKDIDNEYSKKLLLETATETLEQNYRRSNSSSERKP